MILFYILSATFFISLISFAGVGILFLKKELLDKIILFLVAFSAGALIGGAFLHLIPESLEMGGPENVSAVFLFLIIGFCAFFVLENFIRWHHHHHIEECEDCPKTKPFSYLILISDGLHNFIDGLIIAASFLVAIPLGIATALVVALHEIPQEIGDYGILVYGGIQKIKALFLNFFSASLAILGGLIGFFLAERVGSAVLFLLSFAAGNFIYIAASDLIPEIKHKTPARESLMHFLVFLLGIILMFLLKLI